jgi:predicted TIM-barrel fold metal-dependent hydrolase
MIVDFRIQPPYKSFLGIHFYRPRPRVQDPVKGNAFDMSRRPTQSFEDRSMDTFVQEMDEAGVDVGVIMGQQTADRWGSVRNDDIGELLRDYPGRFFGFGGVDPVREGAVDEVQRLAASIPFEKEPWTRCSAVSRTWAAGAWPSCPAGATRP